jgi:hypothetical protein
MLFIYVLAALGGLIILGFLLYVLYGVIVMIRWK